MLLCNQHVSAAEESSVHCLESQCPLQGYPRILISYYINRVPQILNKMIRATLFYAKGYLKTLQTRCFEYRFSAMSKKIKSTGVTLVNLNLADNC